MRWLLTWTWLVTFVATGRGQGPAFTEFSATGHDRRVDLRWEVALGNENADFLVYRADTAEGPFTKLNATVHELPIYSDFVGANDRRLFYRVGLASAGNGRATQFSDTVVAATRAMSDDQLLTSVQEATFRYFWDFAHPVSGMAYERGRSGRLPSRHHRRTCTTGGTGFGLMAIMVGADRQFVTRKQAAGRLLRIVTFLQEKADRFHGAWPHWLDGATGKTIPFSVKGHDDGADLVETSYLVQGMLTVRRYFDRDTATETELRRRIDQLWREVEWDFFLQHPGSKRLYWHWSPNVAFEINMAVVGYNECMITYLLAIASPTHGISADCYYEGWAGRRQYANGASFFGHELWVGRDLGGPLFWSHYSFLGFDPRDRNDRFCNYFQNGRNTALVHRAYCIDNPKHHAGYGADCWGLTASDTWNGYRANMPGNDDGTIAPTAALSSMPYTPAESMAALKHFYYQHGHKLWGAFGFRDAFNVDHDWYASSYLAIDQGPIICMIENHRSQLCWRMFMSNREIAPMLESIGWQTSR